MPAASPVTSACATLPTVAGTTSSRIVVRRRRRPRRSRRRSWAARRPRPSLSGLTSVVIGSTRGAARPWPARAGRAIAASTSGCGDVVRLDDDLGRRGPARELGLDAVVGLHDRQVVRQRVEPRELGVHAERRDGQRDQRGRPTAPAASFGRRMTRVTSAPHDARLAAAADAAEARDAALLDACRPARTSTAGRTVSDPIMPAATTRIVPVPNEANVGVAGQVHAGHRDHHGEAGDQHGATRCRGGDLERLARRAALGALLALTAQVEHRVVDADGQADQQQHRGDRRRSPGATWLTRPTQAERAGHGGQRQQRAGCSAATSAPKATTRISSVIGSDSVSARLKSSSYDFEIALLGAGVAELLDDGTPGGPSARRRPRRASRRRGRSACSSSPSILNSTSADLPSGASWPALPRSSGERDVAHVLGALQARGHVVDRRPGTPGRPHVAPSLVWTSTCSSAVFGNASLDRAVGAAGLADALLVGVGQRVGADRGAQHERDEHECRAIRRWPSCGCARSSVPARAAMF